MKLSFLIRFLQKGWFKRRFIKWFCIFLIVFYPGSTTIGYANSVSLPVKSDTDSLKHQLAKPQSPPDKIKTLSALGKAYYTESELDKALETEYQLLEVISKHGTKNDSAKCFRLIGLVYLQKSWYDKSLDNLM